MIRRVDGHRMLPGRHADGQRRLAVLLSVDRHGSAGGRGRDGDRARPFPERIELLRRLLTVLRGEVLNREVLLEHVRGLLRLIEPKVAFRDVPKLERRTTELVCLLEVPDRVVVTAFG